MKLLVPEVALRHLVLVPRVQSVLLNTSIAHLRHHSVSLTAGLCLHQIQHRLLIQRQARLLTALIRLFSLRSINLLQTLLLLQGLEIWHLSQLLLPALILGMSVFPSPTRTLRTGQDADRDVVASD